MKSRRLLILVGIAALTLEWAPHFANATPHSPEQETFQLSKLLRPISDDEWKTVAGNQISEKYSIIKGDTLFDISKRLFGDVRYWPKLYALNNDSITNPHQIRPGNTIAFMPGTGTSLPAVEISSASDSSSATDPISTSRRPSTPVKGPRSQEWRNLPRQSWESGSVALPPDVDMLGFDKNSKILFKRNKGFELEAVASSDRLMAVGQITGSRSGGEYLAMGDTVFISAENGVQLGETYAITREPGILKSSASDRVGYAYQILGTVKITGIRDDVFIGSVLSSRELIHRGADLIPNPAKVAEPTPIAATEALEAVMMVDRNISTATAAQHKKVFIDRGSEDGIKLGMVFRAYDHHDPSNDKKITSSDFIINANMIVVQVTEKFCTAAIFSGHGPLADGSPAVLLTDISDLTKNHGFSEKTLGDQPKESELDELDNLEGGGNLGVEEKKELEQLERWKGNPPTPPTADPATPAAEPTSPLEDNAPPPPPSDALPPSDAQPPVDGSMLPPAPEPPAENPNALDMLLNQ